MQARYITTRKILAFILAISLVFGMVPITGSALEAITYEYYEYAEEITAPYPDYSEETDAEDEGDPYYEQEYPEGEEYPEYPEVYDIQPMAGIMPLSTAVDISTVIDGASGLGWAFSGDVLTVLDGADIVVTGSVTGGRRIEVAAGAVAEVTLDGVSITGASFQSALLLNTGANLILNVEGINTLTAGSNSTGLRAPGGTYLSINGTGILNANGGPGSPAGAGIGGCNWESGGTITINGGTINAQSGGSAAGIGGGWLGHGGNIAINDGIINASGIGGGFQSDGGNITITGGTVTSIGGWGSAGIGGGSNGGGGVGSSSGGIITISGGTVVATGGSGGAGIGSGFHGACGGTITISGSANVIATGGFNATGIGGGSTAPWGIGASGNITIGNTAQVISNRGASGYANLNSIGAGVSGPVGTINIPINANVTVNGPASIPLLWIESAGQPQDINASVEGTYILSVSATGRIANTLEYQWYESDDASCTNPAPIPGANSSTFEIPNASYLFAGSYYIFAVVTASGTNGTVYARSDTATIVIPPIYGIGLWRSPHPTTNQLIVDVYNAGNTPTGALTVALSGTNSNSFTLSTANIDSIAVNGSSSFLITPNQGLATGTHTATVTVSGGNGISDTFDISFIVDPTGGSSSSSGGSGGGGGGGSSGGGGGAAFSSTVGVASPIVPQAQEQWLTAPAASGLTQTAVAGGQNFTRSRHNGRYGVRADAWANLAGRRFEHDTVYGTGVSVRLIINNPAQMSGDAMVSAWLSGNNVTQTHSRFERWFANQTRVIQFDHAGAWGQTVRVAARVDLTGMNANNLVFYNFDSATNTFRIIARPDYRIDTNGFLWFNTDFGGAIIVSEGPLTRRG